MKKIRITFVLILLLSLCALVLTGCESSLESPTGLILEPETQTLSWEPVQGARFYTIRISGQEQEHTTRETSISLEELPAGEYEIQIKANGDGEVIEDSDWIIYHFTREFETGLKYKLTNNDTAYELIGAGTAVGDIVMEDTFRGKPVVSIADKAFYGNSKITSFTISKNVKTIGEKAFGKCISLTAVTIPEGVTSIGSYAFQSCKVLTSVSLPDSVTEIKPFTFAYCKELKEITVGQKLLSIGQNAFDNCSALTTFTYVGAETDTFGITFPDTMQVVGEYAFSGCTSMIQLDTGAGVETIDAYAFTGCEALTKITFGQAVLEIAEYAFSKCEAVTAITIPNNVQSLGIGAFFGCGQLSEVSLGTGLTNVSYSVFDGTAVMAKAENMLVIDGWLIKLMDTSVSTLTVDTDIYGIASYAIAYCPKLEQADFKGVKYVCSAALCKNENLYLVSFDDALLELGDYVFYDCPFLEFVTLGNQVRSIGNEAFASCDKLDKMTIPQSVTFIGMYAFRDTAAYAAVPYGMGGAVYMGDWVVDYKHSIGADTFGAHDNALVVKEGTRGIASYAFSQKRIMSISLPDSVEYICRGAFYKCKTFNVRLSASLKQIDDYAFYDCESANFGGVNHDLVIPAGITYIGRSAFYNCKEIVCVTIPGNVQVIGPYAFYGCEKLGATGTVEVETGKIDENGYIITETVTIYGFLQLGEGIQTIGDRAFQNCSMLEKIEIPNSVTSLGVRVFYNCTNLKNVKLGSGITSIGDYMFYKCEFLESVTMSGDLDSIGNYAFRGCASLKNVDLKNVKSIGRYAFYGCAALTELVLPDTLTSIGDYAFRGCNGVTSFVIPASVTSIGKHVFYGLKNTTLYCQTNVPPAEWNELFNSSYRPVFWGVTLSEDGKYVMSFTMGTDALTNYDALNGISNPTRAGYIFAGWTTEQGNTTVAYTAENVFEAADGVVLHAVWMQDAAEE